MNDITTREIDMKSDKPKNRNEMENDRLAWIKSMESFVERKMENQPSAGARRAGLKLAESYIENITEEEETLVAQIIDEQTGLKELVEAVQESLTYFDQRADIQTDNPSAPNEEMRLWEELNNALIRVKGTS